VAGNNTTVCNDVGGKVNKSITRRIIALYVALLGVGVMAFLSLMGVPEAFGALVVTVGAVIGYYFGVKSVQS